MIQQQITLISFGYFRKDILEAIAEEVKHQFLLPVIFREGHLDLSEFYDPARRQYNGNRLLKQVDAEFASDEAKTLGLFSVDLFIPILTYIFGQAALNGRTGIASLYRLSNERYGIEPDDKLLLERFTKEVIHELGHTFGLVHCINPSCVMHSSNYVEDIDQKEQHFCLRCREEYKISP
jgi:Predicted Zn-dependent proteases